MNILAYTRKACSEARKQGNLVAISPVHLMYFVQFVEAMHKLSADPADAEADKRAGEAYGQLAADRPVFAKEEQQ